MENINIEILISEVQQREPLWNPKHAGYRNTLVQQRLWDELGASMKMNGMFDRLSYRKYTDRLHIELIHILLLLAELLKRKWQNLRNQYGREKRKTKVPTGSAASTETTWRYFQHLAFLSDVYSSRTTVSNLPNINQIPDETIEILDDNFPAEADVYIEEIENMPLCENDENSLLPSTSRKRSAREQNKVLEELICLEKQKIAKLDEIKQKTEVDPFAASISKDLSKLSMLRQLLAKKEILDVLMKHVKEQEQSDKFN
uniref:uncharacterized protein LOC120956123 n=1 Tax=Anopheles coluzzii TaxID=1518534 RepID=UPI0020FFEB1A|nr:uncharacterized protein LOC120956123 [Anopheles coluzzii]